MSDPINCTCRACDNRWQTMDGNVSRCRCGSRQVHAEIPGTPSALPLWVCVVSVVAVLLGVLA